MPLTKVVKRSIPKVCLNFELKNTSKEKERYVTVNHCGKMLQIVWDFNKKNQRIVFSFCKLHRNRQKYVGQIF